MSSTRGSAPRLPAPHLRDRDPARRRRRARAPSRASASCSGPSSTSRCTRPRSTCRAPSGEVVDDWTDGYLFSLAGPIYAGTNEIQRNVVAERLLGLPAMRFAPSPSSATSPRRSADLLASATCRLSRARGRPATTPRVASCGRGWPTRACSPSAPEEHGGFGAHAGRPGARLRAARTARRARPATSSRSPCCRPLERRRESCDRHDRRTAVAPYALDAESRRGLPARRRGALDRVRDRLGHVPRSDPTAREVSAAEPIGEVELRARSTSARSPRAAQLLGAGVGVARAIGRLRRAAHAVRHADRQLPGGQAPARRRARSASTSPGRCCSARR